jgi:hypothetical protein
MSVKGFLVVLVVVILLAGATGGSASAKNVGHTLGVGVHWIADAWNALISTT